MKLHDCILVYVKYNVPRRITAFLIVHVAISNLLNSPPSIHHCPLSPPFICLFFYTNQISPSPLSPRLHSGLSLNLDIIYWSASSRLISPRKIPFSFGSPFAWASAPPPLPESFLTPPFFSSSILAPWIGKGQMVSCLAGFGGFSQS